MTLPPSVGLRAGVNKTIIDASGRTYGLTVNGGQGATISGLTILGASVCDLAARDANGIRIQGVRLRNSAAGLVLTNVTGGHVGKHRRLRQSVRHVR